MPGNPRHDSHVADGGADSLLTRWSARKRAAVTAPETARSDAPNPSDPHTGDPHPGDPHPKPPAPAQTATVPVLTDADMPPLETLTADSDYRGFLSPGVSEALRRVALRKLFSSARYQIRDGLDDYDMDYNLLQPLRPTLAATVQETLGREIRSQPDAPAAQTAQTDADTRRPSSEPVHELPDDRDARAWAQADDDGMAVTDGSDRTAGSAVVLPAAPGTGR